MTSTPFNEIHLAEFLERSRRAVGRMTEALDAGNSWLMVRRSRLHVAFCRGLILRRNSAEFPCSA